MSILVFEHDEQCGPGRLGRVLVQYGHRLSVRRLWAGESLPPDLDDVEAVVCLDAPVALADLARQAWRGSEAALLKAAHESELPVVGLGTGSLILAAALGGSIAPLEGGKVEVGWREGRLTFPGTLDPVLTGQPWRSMMLVWQIEQVTKLPAGAAPLAGSAACRTLAWRAGIRTYGFQPHIEADAAAVERWSQARSAQRRAAGLSHEELQAATRRWMPDFERLSERLCRCIADYLLPAVLRRCS